MRLLLISDTHEKLGIINELAHNVRANLSAYGTHRQAPPAFAGLPTGGASKRRVGSESNGTVS